MRRGVDEGTLVVDGLDDGMGPASFRGRVSGRGEGVGEDLAVFSKSISKSPESI